jgi:hypothetical protein
MVDTSSKDNNDTSSPPSFKSMGNKTQMNCNINLNKMKQDRMKRNIPKKSSNLLIYHQNIRGINNKTDELLSQWESKFPHVLCLTEHLVTKAEITRISINSYNLGAYFCRKSRKDGGVSIFVHQNSQYTPTDLDEFLLTKKLKFAQ